MPGKARIPAPIDRPLSRAYLREFTGWSSAYPPGISDPTSLRIMENVMVNRDGSARIRPGLRHLSWRDSGGTLLGIDRAVVGTHETFFLNDGTKAYLFAVREADNTVGFRVLAQSPLGQVVQSLTAAGFSVPQTEAVLAFTAATTYVKYLQIDNKVFALSNAGETMRLFYVGESKVAKKLGSIERPDWAVADKLTVVHPDAAWVNGAVPTSTRTNLFANPAGELVTGWAAGADTDLAVSTTFAQAGTKSFRLASKPTRTNLVQAPLHDVATTGVTGWTASVGAASASANGSAMRVNFDPGGVDRRAYVVPTTLDVVAGTKYQVAFDLTGTLNADQVGVRWRWYNTAGAEVGSFTDNLFNNTVARKITAGVTAPAGATKLRLYIFGIASSSSAATFSIKDVICCNYAEITTPFSGSSGADYYWTGTVNASASVYHPPKTVTMTATVSPLTPAAYIASAYFRSSATARATSLDINWRGGSGGSTSLATTAGATVNDASGAWTRNSVTGTGPAGTTQAIATVRVAAVPRGENHYVDSLLFETGSTLLAAFDGETTDTSTLKYSWTGTANASASKEDTFTGSPAPVAETKTASTLIATTGNAYNFGFFYTFGNEVGESAASQVSVVRALRSWASWRWETPNAAGEPSGTGTNNPEAAADQLVASMPQAVFDAAIAQGATHWNLYAFTWSDQDPVPVSAVRIGRRDLAFGADYASNSWLRMTPQMADAGDEVAPLPKANSRYNFSNPSRGAQGIVASDRMVLVNDPTAAAVIRWTSNQQGNYTDFSAARGGGYKTLTSGNLYVPACVKLWQNPQSVDTLTVLCMGVDGMSTGYYMAPAQVASQSEATNIMGFEETTATPGTTSPFGVEVFNNALYHPLDDQLMKSTANNYNISHKAQTDQIANSWSALETKHRIVSSQHDNRLYYLVNNPLGAELEDGCWGNEVWVLDAAADAGSWSRWLVQGHSLRKIEQGGKIVMSLVRPDGIFYFDPDYASDDVVDPTTKAVTSRPIPWKLETNTQGANRAHDAWARLQQCNIVVGFFSGVLRYGIRGWDLNGKEVNVSKLTRDGNPVDELAYDLEDYLRIARDLKEWFFYAESVTDEAGNTLPSAGQINLVQYRYTPSSVNTGYEYGSIETFEYGRAGNALDARTTDNGVPIPYVDTGRP